MLGKLDGAEIKEVYVTSTTAIGDLYVYSYLYNLEGHPEFETTIPTTN